MSMQAKLLRVLQEGRFRRIGSRKELEFKARVVVATNRDLTEEVRLGRFREDLFYRFNVIPVHLPPLRDRAEDIVPLAQRLLDKHCQRAGLPTRRLSKEAQTLLLAHRWPGNIRELGNAMERVVAFADADILQPEDFNFLRSESARIEGSDPLLDDWPSLEELEHRYVEKVMKKTGGHRGKTCDILGIDPKTLYRKLREN
jgi:DNA-binding NtrC family response regulator